jgi:hypothetical protein
MVLLHRQEHAVVGWASIWGEAWVGDATPSGHDDASR